MSFIFFGSGQLNTLSTFYFSILILLGPMTTSRNPTFYTFYIHFSSLIYKLFSSSLLNTSSTILLYFSSVSISTNISSTKATTFPSLIISLRILFIIIWNIAGEFVIPKNMAIGSKNLIQVVNAPFHLFFSLILTLLNLYQRSILVNTCLLSMLSIKSIINESRQLFFTIWSFRLQQSITILFLPFFLFVITRPNS